MQREIKFRAWNGSHMLEWGWIEAMSMISEVILNRGGYYNRIQYTGLKDKNGKEIYEGDIVRYQCNSACSDEYRTFAVDQVIFTRGGFACERTFGQLWAKGNGCTEDGQLLDVEVIGNIYENPKLLKGGSNG